MTEATTQTALAVLLLGLAAASCGVPGMIEGPVPLKEREGAGEYRQVAACAYMALDRRYSSALDFPLQKTDMQSVIYIDQRAESASMRLWRLIISPSGTNRTRIELHAPRPVIETGIYERVISDASTCLDVPPN